MTYEKMTAMLPDLQDLNRQPFPPLPCDYLRILSFAQVLFLFTVKATS